MDVDVVCEMKEEQNMRLNRLEFQICSRDYGSSHDRFPALLRLPPMPLGGRADILSKDTIVI